MYLNATSILHIHKCLIGSMMSLDMLKSLIHKKKKRFLSWGKKKEKLYFTSTNLIK